MMKKQASYKTRGMSNGHINARKGKTDEEKTNQTVIIGVVGVGLLLVILLYLTFGGSSIRGQSVIVGTEHISQLSEDKRNIPIEDKYANIMGQKIFYRECNPVREVYHRVDLLFLHGAKYSSSTWKGLGTLQIFASYGYRTIGIDLPGYGLSKNNLIDWNTDAQRVTFIETFIAQIDLKHVVIIAPSMGGDYGIPVLMSASLNELTFELKGFVAIAPNGVNKHNKVEYQKVNVPTLILWGERDRTEQQQQSHFLLPNIPDSVEMMIPKAQHAAFVGNPQAFHTYILTFLTERCTLTKDDYEEDFDFGTYEWLGSFTDYSTDDYDYDLASMWDSLDSLSYDFDDDDFLFDDQFDDTYSYSDDTTSLDTSSLTSDDTSMITSDDTTESSTTGTWWGNWGRRIVRRLTGTDNNVRSNNNGRNNNKRLNRITANLNNKKLNFMNQINKVQKGKRLMMKNQ